VPGTLSPEGNRLECHERERLLTWIDPLNFKLTLFILQEKFQLRKWVAATSSGVATPVLLEWEGVPPDDAGAGALGGLSGFRPVGH
jgi:hypothetical protein